MAGRQPAAVFVLLGCLGLRQSLLHAHSLLILHDNSLSVIRQSVIQKTGIPFFRDAGSDFSLCKTDARYYGLT